jgi:hypothetical protein
MKTSFTIASPNVARDFACRLIDLQLAFTCTIPAYGHRRFDVALNSTECDLEAVFLCSVRDNPPELPTAAEPSPLTRTLEQLDADTCAMQTRLNNLAEQVATLTERLQAASKELCP